MICSIQPKYVNYKLLLPICAIAMPILGASASNAQEQIMPNLPPINMVDHNSINIVTGDLALDELGVSIGEENFGRLVYKRTWTSRYWHTNWQYNVTGSLDFVPNAAGQRVGFVLMNINAGDKNDTFIRGADNLTTPLRKNGASVIIDGSAITYTGRDGEVIKYDTVNQGLSFIGNSITKANGETIKLIYHTTPSYAGRNHARLQSVQTNYGYQLKFEYVNDNFVTNSNQNGQVFTDWWEVKKVTAINDSVEYCSVSAFSCHQLAESWPSVQYIAPPPITRTPLAGTSFSEQATRSDGSGFVYNIRYTPNGLYYLDSRSELDMLYSQVTFSYGSPNYISTLPFSMTNSSGTWAYTSSIDSMNTQSALDDQQLIYRTSPSGKVDTYRSLTFYSLLGRTDPLGRTTRYRHDNSLRLVQVVPPEASSTNGEPTAGYTGNEYDGRGNVVRVTKVAKAGSGLADLVYEAGFDSSCGNIKTCNQPNWVRDPKGNQIDYTYDGAHGGVLSEMQPAPSSGAARPLTLSTWAQRYGWIKSSSGTLVQQAEPIWMIASKTVCQTAAGSSAPVCDGAAPQTVTTYEYGASGTREALLIKGLAVSSGGTTLRTCYSYDIYNRKVSETTPNANQGACP